MTSVAAASPSSYLQFGNGDSRRQSLVSTSAASFQTAATALSRSDSRASDASVESISAQTIGAGLHENGHINPIHLLSQTSAGNGKEVHVVKVSGDNVQLQNGPPPQSLIQRTGKTVAHVLPRIRPSHGISTAVGALPPSPPESPVLIGEFIPPSPPLTPSKGPRSLPGSASTGPPPSAFELSDRKLSISSIGGAPTIRSHSAPEADLPPIDSGKHRSSTDTRTSAPSATTSSLRAGRTSLQSEDNEPASTPETSISDRRAFVGPKPTHLSTDGYLQPPLNTVRPARRNTTGSVQAPVTHRPSKQLSHTHHHSILIPRSHDDAELDGELDSDILYQADQIRKERLSRKRLQQEAEAALSKVGDDTQVMVGNLIGEGHANYILMYNMLTGIRIGFSRCQAKIKRPLTDEDFVARHKFSFDIVGNELTPSAKYDFKFKDYAPWVFRELREDYFGLDPADYLLSLTAKYILSELGSPGKSGSFFYFSRDYRFIIKTIHRTEHNFLRSILKQYYEHVKSNPHTLLSRFYGLHRVKLPRGKKIHFVIMNNLFPPHKDIHETYDLKGSTVGRLYPEDKTAQNPRATLKDLNWINRQTSLELGPEKRAYLTEQLRRDSEFLKSIHVMDYSLLVGIHNMQRGNGDNVRRNTLKVFNPPSVPPIRRKPTSVKGQSPEAIAMRKAIRESDPKRMGADTIDLPEVDTGDRQQFIFYQDEGGYQATDESNRPMDKIYYLGVIDILTPYNTVKRMEHVWKGLSADRHKISPVPPAEYGDRFFDFMKAIMRGGGGGERFKVTP